MKYHSYQRRIFSRVTIETTGKEEHDYADLRQIPKTKFSLISIQITHFNYAFKISSTEMTESHNIFVKYLLVVCEIFWIRQSKENENSKLYILQ